MKEKLWELAEGLKDVEKLFEEGEITEEEKKEMEEAFAEMVKEKGESIMHYVFQLKDEIQELKDEKKRIQEHTKRVLEMQRAKENKLDNFKKYILYNLDKLEMKSLETKAGKMTTRTNKKLVVDDIDKLGLEFIERKIEVTRKLKEKEIKSAIKNGEEIEGVHIEETKSLIIK
jgi:hypothetical protein